MDKPKEEKPERKPNPTLEEVVNSLRYRFDQLQAYLNGDTSISTRVANAPSIPIDKATAQARQFWDDREAEQRIRKRRSSIPPKHKL
jgi:hypothetical protein